MIVRPARTQISLGIRPVWSESSLSAWRNIGSLATHWAHSEDSDQIGRMPRLIWVFAGPRLIWVFARRTLILLVFSCRGSYQLIFPKKQCSSVYLYHSNAKCQYLTMKPLSELETMARWGYFLELFGLAQISKRKINAESGADKWELSDVRHDSTVT